MQFVAEARRTDEPFAATSIDAFLRSLEGLGPEGPCTRPPSPRPDSTPAAQHDFAARLRWSVTPSYAGANHEPAVAVRGGGRVVARPGETVRLQGAASDPDGNAVVARREHGWRAPGPRPIFAAPSPPDPARCALAVPPSSRRPSPRSRASPEWLAPSSRRPRRRAPRRQPRPLRR